MDAFNQKQNETVPNSWTHVDQEWSGEYGTKQEQLW